MPWPEKGYQVVQFAQIILKWRSREQQDVVAWQFLEELVSRCQVILAFMGLINDHEVPTFPEDLISMILMTSPIERCDGAICLTPIAGFLDRCELLEEFVLELFDPLCHQ
jgi:hypothetical protein